MSVFCLNQELFARDLPPSSRKNILQFCQGSSSLLFFLWGLGTKAYIEPLYAEKKGCKKS